MARLVLASFAIAALMTLSSCTADTATSLTRCEAAHQAAGSVGEMQDTVSDYYPTYRACSDLSEWTAAATAYSDLDASQIRQWPTTQCATEPSLQSTNVCNDIVTPTAEATFEVVCPDGFTVNVRAGQMSYDEAVETFCEA